MMDGDAMDVFDRTRVAVAVDTRGVLVRSTVAVEVAVLAVLGRSAGVVDGILPMDVGTSGP
jgi:hypothetical protein